MKVHCPVCGQELVITPMLESFSRTAWSGQWLIVIRDVDLQHECPDPSTDRSTDSPRHDTFPRMTPRTTWTTEVEVEIAD